MPNPKEKKSWLPLILTLSAIVALLFFCASLSPAPAHNYENTVAITGVLESVSTCCPGGDVIFDLEGHDNRYYINRALEEGFDLDMFVAEVSIGDTVTIRASERHLRKDPIIRASQRSVSSAEIATANKVYFSIMP